MVHNVVSTAGNGALGDTCSGLEEEAAPEPESSKKEEEDDDPWGQKALMSPYLLQEKLNQKVTGQCWQVGSRPDVRMGFGATVFQPQLLSPKAKEDESPFALHPRPMASTKRPDLFEKERPRPLTSFGKPLSWWKGKELERLCSNSLGGKHVYQSFAAANYEDGFCDQNGNRTRNGRTRLFNPREQRRQAARLLRLGSMTNRNAVDFGHNHLGPSQEELDFAAQVAAQKHEALNEDEEKAAEAQGIEVFGRVRKWIQKTKKKIYVMLNSL